ncbi:protein-tyrosine phosphatase-like protein [Talaromyces proteolyticus]|uniref:Protein-tyrosine phosphatase-like protein n=1 Tax=Talaromyces proteolyticus TaxID=1131652 RepID=A0AAD4L0W0_9EURO|nr:protein-tyrosine phosphatase-like protein [Talaromyces proteolyticus]KAH8701820.1 protein-tyrosine phosphatase-like protein [Talaromyces proteolyticus]
MSSSTTSSAGLAAHAASQSVPSPPFIQVDGIPNFRDIGGYPITEASSTRRNFIFRSGLPTRVTANGVKTLTQDLKVDTIYDLRSNAELRKDPASALLTSMEGVKVLHTPVFPEKDISPAQLANRYACYMSDKGTEGFVAAYSEILRDGTDAYKTIFEHVRDHPDKPFLVHCTGGKDRTGVVIALLLLVAGVKSWDVVAEEYALTEIAFDAKIRAVFVEKVVADMGVDTDRAGVLRMISARKENMIATLEFIEGEYGGPEEYVKKALGFEDHDIEIIRKNLTVEEKGIF